MHRMSEPANKGFNKIVNCTSCAISIYLLFMNKTGRQVLPEIDKTGKEWTKLNQTKRTDD